MTERGAGWAEVVAAETRVLAAVHRAFDPGTQRLAGATSSVSTGRSGSD